MKYRNLLLLMLTFFLAGVYPVQAEFGVRLSVGMPERGYHHGSRDHYRPYWPGRPYREIDVDQDVIVAPYYASYPYPVYLAPPPIAIAPTYVPPSGWTGNYGIDFANLNAKLGRLRGLLQRQSQKEGLTQDQYSRYISALDGIEHDEHARAYDRGGYLGSEDIADLNQRLDQVRQDIEIALSQ